MVNISKAASILQSNFAYNSGLFYGTAQGLSLGVGLIYNKICYPLYNDEDKVFDTVDGLVYVLTHECDVDVGNERFFNEHVLVCPITKFEDFAFEFSASGREDAFFGMLPDLAKDSIFRVFYLPPIPPHINSSILPFGGIIYLNQIVNTHVTIFAEGTPICALSQYASRVFDFKLQNHLLRPKSEFLPRLQ